MQNCSLVRPVKAGERTVCGKEVQPARLADIGEVHILTKAWSTLIKPIISALMSILFMEYMCTVTGTVRTRDVQYSAVILIIHHFC